METKKRMLYEAPVAQALDVKPQEIICTSEESEISALRDDYGIPQPYVW